MMDSDHTTPDGTLHFLVRSPDGDRTMGFDGFAWHTHGDILAALSTGTPEEATERFITDLITGKLIIAVAKTSGVTRDVWITDDPVGHLRYCPPEETIEFHRWDGTRVTV